MKSLANPDKSRVTDSRDRVHVAVTIMAHPSRTEQAESLADSFRELPVRITFDPDPAGPRSTVRVARLAWYPWHGGVTHFLVLQDDVELHPDFERQVQHAIAAQPEAVISYFSEWGSFTSHALRIAALAQRPFVDQPDTYFGTQAISMPTAYAKEFVSELEQTDLGTPDDHVIRRFAVERGVPYYVTNPNLVDHDTAPSLVGNDFQGARRATVYDPESALPAEWWMTGPLPQLQRIPSMHWSTCVPSEYVRPDDPTARWDLLPGLPSLISASESARQAIAARSGWLTTIEADDEYLDATDSLLAIALAQALVAGALPNNIDTELGRRLAQAATASIAPGSLRRAAAVAPRAFEWEKGIPELQRLVTAAVREPERYVDIDAVRNMYYVKSKRSEAHASL